MHDIRKIILLAAMGIMFSACSDRGASSAETNTHADADHSHAHNDEEHHKDADVNAADKDRSKVSETRSADSHTHGGASLAIVLEGSQLIVELDSPLYNVLGFEHAAETAAQKAAVLKAETILSNGAGLFEFNNEAACSAISDHIEVDLDFDDHDEEGHHDDHDDHDDEEADEHESHKDIVLQYEYMCRNPKALKYVTVKLFESFENLTDIELVYLGPNIQRQDILSPNKTRMNLKR